MVLRGSLRTGSAALLIVLASCGGGGGDSGGNSPPVQAKEHLVGRVWIGPVAQSVVTAYRLAADGSRTPLESATSNAEGSYAMDADAPAGSVIQIEAVGGLYKDSRTGLARTLDVPLRLTFVAQTPNGSLTISALSEVATRVLASMPPSGDLVADVRSANDLVSNTARLPNFVGLNLGGPCSFATVCEVAFVAASISTMQRRWALSSLEEVLQRLTVIWSGGTYDERLVPELVRAEYEQSQGADPLIGQLTLGSIGPIDANALPFWIPNGAPGPDPSMRMPDGVYAVLSDEPSNQGPVQAMHRFNQRGALVAIEGASTGHAIRQFSTVTDDLYADGEVSIGRWFGGALASGVNVFATNGTNYALGLPAPLRIDCAFELFDLAAATAVTQPFVTRNPAVQLLGGSRMSVQHLGDGHDRLAFDVSFMLPDGSTQRVQTDQGILQAWQGARFEGAQSNIVHLLSSSPGGLSGLAFDYRGQVMRAGAAGDKIVQNMQFNGSPFAAVFKRTDVVPPRADICAPDNATATPISQLPPGGPYRYLSRDLQTSGLVTWRGDGSVGTIVGDVSAQPVELSVDPSVSSRELASSGLATIGRVFGPYGVIFGDEPATRSVTYATVSSLALDQSAPPMTFQLKTATTPVVRAVDPGWSREIVSGHIDSAVLVLTPGISNGMINPYTGEGTLSITGVVGGVPYQVDAKYVSLHMMSGSFSGEAVLGSVSGPDARYAVVVVYPQYGAVAEFALILERQP